jgi:hydrogenase nickel incorporation protein HypB
MGLSVLQRNAELAAHNRERFNGAGVLALNILSAPGSGKTALLERTLADCAGRWRMGVIVGDLQTDNDARRLRRTGSPAVQITTGAACHLDAHMVAHASDDVKFRDLDILFIENVGNLVCPALFDLGEHARVVLFSVTEGEDKPLKYPTIFADADLVLITKSDLAGPADFRSADAHAGIRAAAPRADILTLSSRSGDGMHGWYEWLARKQAAISPVPA